MPQKQIQQFQKPLLQLHSTTETRPNQMDSSKAAAFGISPQEFVRRDNIVRETWLKNLYKQGEVVRPRSDDLYEKFGRLTVRGVFKTYFDFSIESSKDWPANDRPLIVSCTPDKGDAKMILCHPDTLCRFFQNNCGGES